MTPHSRRDFLRLACCSAATASIVGGLSKFGLVSAMAQGTTDYKALVCIFFFGGNDSNNMIVPFDTAGYTNYQTRACKSGAQQGLAPAAANRRTVALWTSPQPAGLAGAVQQQQSAGRSR